MEYNQIFQPQTLEKLNKRSQDNLKKIMGNKSLMQTLISSQKLLGEIMQIEAPYKDQLEQLAIQMVEDMYPIILEDNIKIDAKIVNVADVNQSLDEIKVNKPGQKYKIFFYSDSYQYADPIEVEGSIETAKQKTIEKLNKDGNYNPNILPNTFWAIITLLDPKEHGGRKEVGRVKMIDEKYQFYKLSGTLNESTPESKRRVIDEIKVNNPYRLSTIALQKIKNIFPDAILNKDWLNRGDDFFQIQFYKKERPILNVDRLDYNPITKKFNVSLGPSDLHGRYFKNLDNAIKYLKQKKETINEIRVNNPNNLLKFVKYYDTTNLGYITFNGEKITGDSKLNDKEVRIYFDEYEKLPKNIQSFFYKRDGWYFTKNFQTDDKTDIDYKYNLNESTPESKRRVINGITQGAALHGTFSFYMFKEYLDAIDDNLVEKYNQLMKEVFGVYDDDNAIAMFLNAIAQGQKTGGGSSKVIIKEIKVNNPNIYTIDYAINLFEKLTKERKDPTPSIYVGNKPYTEYVLSKISKKVSLERWINILFKNKPLFKQFIDDLIKLKQQYNSQNQIINEIKVNKPKINILIYNEEYDQYWVEEDKVLLLLSKKFPNNEQNIKDYVEEINDGSNPEAYLNITLQELYTDFLDWKKDNEDFLTEEQQKGPTIQARAICFPMLVHEIIKGLYELVSLQGFSGTKDQNQQVVDKVDKLENEPHDLKYGKFIFDALNNIFADSQYSDPRIREFFFAEVYQLGDTEFVEFIENAVNEQLSSTQKRWVEQTLKEISSDLKADDFDSTGLDEIKIK
jgi:hypothetical protein